MGLVAPAQEIHAKAQKQLPKALIIVLGDLMHDDEASRAREQEGDPNPERQQDEDPHAAAERLHGDAPDARRTGSAFKQRGLTYHLSYFLRARRR